jgi:methionyl-tRNA synthetase
MFNKDKTSYITTTLPYVNADPHIGFAFEAIQADIFARYKKLLGEDVFFNTGADEHGQKIYQNALKEGKDTQEYVDGYADKLKNLKVALNLSYNNFIRTTDSSHAAAAQEFWNRCNDNGDIYKKNYEVKYCVGCELEKTDSELEDGCCPLHPNKEVEIRNEENYFFRFSEYGDKLLDLYKKNPDFVIPKTRLNEITKFIERGLKDFSISRLKDKMPWGINVPYDKGHVMSVWFDALVNYISAIGWPTDMEKFNKYWPVIQFAGKDQVRQQSAMWQAMLMSANLKPSKKIVIHGFVTSKGQKISKSLGNTIDPFEIVEEYGTDALRYYLAREISPFEDGDFTVDKFKEAYNSNLANGLGNLTNRIMKMSEMYLEETSNNNNLPKDIDKSEFFDHMSRFDVQKAVDVIWTQISSLDVKIQEIEPFKLIKEDKERALSVIRELVDELYVISHLLSIILPETSEKIKKAIERNKMPSPLFLRK